MSNIKVLDCTLRDGGYVNSWNFGCNNIKIINENLLLSDVDYIELGYLTNKKKYNQNYTCFNSTDEMKDLIASNDHKYLCMINYSEYDINDIEFSTENNLFGIRVAFHKKDMVEALEFSYKLKEKGYKVFVQPMLTMCYSNDELEKLILEVNKLNPYAFYLVDSFGYMTERDINEKVTFILNTINDNIILGFHSHNNLQLSFSNTVSFIQKAGKKEIILDSSVYGMGRGAGNLNSELIMQFLNENYNGNYKISPLLYIVDRVLEKIKKDKNWGYSLVYYLSATYKCHPNYANFYNNFATLSIHDISEILNLISDEKKSKFDESYAQELYEAHFNYNCDENVASKGLIQKIKEKPILLVGSGSSIATKKDEITQFIKEYNPFVISVNNNNNIIPTDAIFFSSRKRYNDLKDNFDNKCMIATSNVNINSDEKYIFDYKSNLAREYKISDNALLLLINIIKKIGVNKIYLAGFDGYRIEPNNNYYTSDLSYVIDYNRINNTNSIMKYYIEIYSKDIEIEFITPTLYI